MLNGVNVMFNKKMKLFLISLVFMLSLSAVVAADSNSTDDMMANDLDEEPPSGSVENVNISDSLSAAQDDCVGVDGGDDILSANVSSSHKLVSGKNLTKSYDGKIAFYSATFYNNDGSVLKNAHVKFMINGKQYTNKTNDKGVAKLAIGLNPGTYTVYAIHPDGFNITNKVVIKTSIAASNLNKHYKSSKNFKVTFYNKKGKVLANKYVKFYTKGQYYVKKTNSKGVATLNIISKPGSFKVKAINPDTGEKKTKTVKVLPTLYADKMTVFSDKTSKFKVTLYKNEKLVKNAKVYVYIKGNRVLAKTDKNGVASFNFKLSKGTYTFKSFDPYTEYSIKTKITVKFATIHANNMIVHENKTSKYSVTLLKSNGKVCPNTNMSITLNGETHTVKTNSKGVATMSFNLNEGTYSVICKDLSNGYKVTKKITVLKSDVGMEYSQYGVSADGKTILAIGRASASGEMSKYGYSFFKTEFLRTCPYCGSHDLYWSIFWAGSETADYGVFPATGHKEGGSAEGHIFCAQCDCDWSVFGNNHGTGGDLTVVSKPEASSKVEAYELKSGNYINV